jgi:mannose-6-phosphate isomerase-like protein (cupin superfamily)
MPRAIRRVVTGHDAAGKAVVLFDGEAPNRRVRPHGPISTLLWVTDEVPTTLSDSDRAEREIGTPPPIGGTIFRILEIPPAQERTPAELEQFVADIKREQAENPQPGIQRNPTVRAPGLHRTESVDYALVLEGEIVMQLDDSETPLKAGDMVVMQGCNHGWANRSGKTCMMAFILVGAEVPWA